MTPTLTHLGPAIRDVALIAFASFSLSMILTPIYTTLAFRFKAWKRVRDTAITGEKAPIYHKLHAAKHKRNIPTMAGIVIVGSIGVITGIFNLSREQTYLPLFGVVSAGAIGLLDDLINIRGENLGIAGMRGRIKMGMLLVVATAAAAYAYFKLEYTSLYVPYLGQVEFSWLLIPFFIFVIVATANAVNITDGLDGLSGGLLSIAFGVYSIIALLQGNFGIAAFCATVCGALLSYTWFNIYPARFFMGDSGSFALGTALALVALLTDTLFLLPIIGGVFVVEAGSSLLQIASKKLFKRKIFLSAPLHHHFEAMGWPETKVTMRFWILGSVLGVLALVIAISGGQLNV